LEHLKLITKEFLYQCQIKGNEPIFNNLKQIIKYKIKIEKQHSKLISFERKWNRQLIECLKAVMAILLTLHRSLCIYPYLPLLYSPNNAPWET
jgi:hypothetical protein